MACQRLEVGVLMKNGRIDANGNCPDKTANKLANSLPFLPTTSIKNSRLIYSLMAFSLFLSFLALPGFFEWIIGGIEAQVHFTRFAVPSPLDYV